MMGKLEENISALFGGDFLRIKNSLYKIASSIGEPIPAETISVFSKIERILSYKDAKDFLENAPAEMRQVSELENLIRIVEEWGKIADNVDSYISALKFCSSALVPAGDNTLMFLQRTIDAMKINALFIQPWRNQEFLERCESFRRTYIQRYIEFHDHFNKALEKIQPDVDKVARQAEIIEQLSSLPVISAHCDKEGLVLVRRKIQSLKPCPHSPSYDEISENYFCPMCNKTLLDSGLLDTFKVDIEMWQRKYEQCVSALSKALSDAIMSADDRPLESFLKALQVADIQSIYNIFSPELLERIKQILLTEDTNNNNNNTNGN